MIPIVLAADHNYAMPLKVTIGSILYSANIATCYKFYILTDRLFCVDELFQLKIKYPNFDYIVYRMDEKELDNVKLNNEGLSVFTFCRLFLSEVLTDCEKCIYIDTDTLVLTDLTELYKRDMGEFCVSGVKDYGLQSRAKINKKGHSGFSLSEMESYINAGVLLVNLKKIRRDHIFALFKHNIDKSWEYDDQDIINK